MSARLLDDRSGMSTLTSALDLRARQTPDRIAYRFLRDGEVETETVGYGALRQRALVIARRLSALGARGERAVLVFPQGLSFLSAFFACLYAGVVAVPVSVPNRRRGIDVVKRIAADARARFLVSTPELLDELRARDGVLEGLTALSCEDPALEGGDLWLQPDPDPGGVALLQYTSGTTSSPRGVIVTHANLADNHRQVATCLATDADAKYVSWLPMFHDMGLGIALQSVWFGVEVILMPPRSFVQHPIRWLSAIDRYRATTSGGPDSAYELCIRRIAPAERARLDLSSWRVAYNGSEPVSAAGMERFAEAFAASGFRYAAFHPVYGLAEGTLLVSSEAPSDAPVVRHFDRNALGRGEAVPVVATRGRALVSCGRPWPGTSIAIVEPTSRRECAGGRVGEIWIRGPGVARGYFGRDHETVATFAAVTAAGDGGYLNSGDLGFVHEGRLFVLGRRADVLVRDDITYYPHDIEEAAWASHPALAPHGAAAFTSGPHRGLVLACEIARSALRKFDPSAVEQNVRQAIEAEHGLVIDAVALLQPGTLPRTTSGKVRRSKTRDDFRDGGLALVAPAQKTAPARPPAPLEQPLVLPAPSERAERLIAWLRTSATEPLRTHEADPSSRMNPPLRVLSKMGLLGMQVGEEYGGQGLSQLDAVRVLAGLGAADFKAAVAVVVNDQLGILPIARHGSRLVKSWLLPGLVHAEDFAAFASIDALDPKRSHAATASVSGDVFRLSGAMLFDCVVDTPTLINVFARERGAEVTRAFVVSGKDLRFEPVEDKLGGRELGFSRGIAALDGVLVADTLSLGREGEGAAIQRESVMHLRLGLAAACAGGLRRCARLISAGVPYRAGFPLRRTPNPLTLSRLGAIKARTTALGCLAESIAHALDSGRSAPAEAFAACSLLGTELLLRSVEDLFKLGIALDPVDRECALGLYRDAGMLQNQDEAGESLAEITGRLVIEGNAATLAALGSVFGAEAQTLKVERVLETIRSRATKLNATLAQRAQRWASTRAGELTSWLLLVWALDGAQRATPRPELRHAHAWAEAQFESALAAVRFGTPAEVAAIDSAEAAATFGAYAESFVT